MTAVQVGGLLLVILSGSCGPRAVSGVLHGPRNVRVSSYNMDLVVRWDPPPDAPLDLVYTTEYSSPASSFLPRCIGLAALSCDLTAPDVPWEDRLTAYGNYTCRVRAERGAEHSVWVQSRPLILDEETTIGPPSVSLVVSGVYLEVTITDPVFRMSSLRELYNYATYNVTYWKEHQEDKAVSASGLQQNPVGLSGLEPWTRYCVRVQILTGRNPMPSLPSSTTCRSTADKESAPWIEALVTFVVMAMLVTGAVVAVVNRKKLTGFFCPPDSLPQHFKEYLLEPPSSSLYLAVQNSSPPVEAYDQVSVLASDRNEGAELSPAAEEGDCTVRQQAEEERTFDGGRAGQDEKTKEGR